MDEVIFRDIDDLFERFFHNLNHWFSDHGFEITIILIVGWLVHRFGSQFVARVLQSTIRPDLYPTKGDRTKRLKTIESLADALLKLTVYAIAALMIISELGVDTTPVLASAGIIGIALGFGAQSLIKDFTSGLFIIIDNQYRVGDVVRFNDEVSGVIEAITIRTTVVRALDGTLYHMPNGAITWTANKTMSYGGIEEDIVFPHEVDIERLRLIIDQVGEGMAREAEFKRKIKEPPHFLRIVGFDEHGIKVKIVAITGSADSWEVKGEFYKRLIKELRRAKIDMPSTQISIKQEK